jgi:hypothetical protein
MVQEHVLNSDSHEPSSFIIKELLISQITATVNSLTDFSHRPYQIPNKSKKTVLEPGMGSDKLQ